MFNMPLPRLTTETKRNIVTTLGSVDDVRPFVRAELLAFPGASPTAVARRVRLLKKAFLDLKEPEPEREPEPEEKVEQKVRSPTPPPPYTQLGDLKDLPPSPPPLVRQPRDLPRDLPPLPPALPGPRPRCR